MSEFLKLPPDYALLNRPIWSALNSTHRDLARGGAMALRYPTEVAPFAGTVDEGPEAMQALAEILPETAQCALFTQEEIEVPAGMESSTLGTIHQMVATACPAFGPETLDPRELGFQDVPEMLLLTELTKPGPFGKRTVELGEYIGIRVAGKLVAMVGERMQIPGFSEISAACVHPDHRGKGYACSLVEEMMRRIYMRGTVPFLHVFTTNIHAVSLYEDLGFESRAQFNVTRIWRRAS